MYMYMYMYQRFAICRHRARELQACPSMAFQSCLGFSILLFVMLLTCTLSQCVAQCNLHCCALSSAIWSHFGLNLGDLGPNFPQFGTNSGPEPSQNRGSWAPKPPQIEVLRGLEEHFGPLGPQEAPRAKTGPKRGAVVHHLVGRLGSYVGPCWGHVGLKMAPRGLQEASKMHSISTSISTSIFHRFWRPSAPILGRFWELCWLQNR